jgi:hypothetical protein
LFVLYTNNFAFVAQVAHARAFVGNTSRPLLPIEVAISMIAPSSQSQSEAALCLRSYGRVLPTPAADAARSQA